MSDVGSRKRRMRRGPRVLHKRQKPSKCGDYVVKEPLSNVQSRIVTWAVHSIKKQGWPNNEHRVGVAVTAKVGTGKTRAGIAIATSLTPEKSGQILVISPLSLMDQWVDEIGRLFGDEIDVEICRDGHVGSSAVVITNYDSMEKFLDIDWVAVIVDEAHAVRNGDTQRYGIMEKFAGVMVLLTATPINNCLEDLVHLAWQTGALQRSNPSETALDVLSGSGEELLFALRAAFLRAGRELTIPIERKVETLTLTADEERDYNAYITEKLAQGDTNSLHRFIVSIHACALSRAKIRAVEELLRSFYDPERGLVILATMKKMQMWIYDLCVGLGLPVGLLTSSMSPKERARVVSDLNTKKIRILVASAGVSGEGWNMQHGACDMIVVDLPFNPQAMKQREGRVCRFEQKRNVRIRYLVIADSPEAKIPLLYIRKTNLAKLASEVIPGLDSYERGKLRPTFEARSTASFCGLIRQHREVREAMSALSSEQLHAVMDGVFEDESSSESDESLPPPSSEMLLSPLSLASVKKAPTSLWSK